MELARKFLNSVRPMMELATVSLAMMVMRLKMDSALRPKRITAKFERMEFANNAI